MRNQCGISLFIGRGTPTYKVGIFPNDQSPELKSGNQIWGNQATFHGDMVYRGPDLMIGYSPGYRASAETGVGGWAEEAVVPNTDRWMDIPEPD